MTHRDGKVDRPVSVSFSNLPKKHSQLYPKLKKPNIYQNILIQSYEPRKSEEHLVTGIT